MKIKQSKKKQYWDQNENEDKKNKKKIYINEPSKRPYRYGICVCKARGRNDGKAPWISYMDYKRRAETLKFVKIVETEVQVGTRDFYLDSPTSKMG